MLHSPRWLTIVALALVATAARAEFHTFQIDELYSNADGSVQYVVLHESQGFNGENLLAGHFLTSTHLGVMNFYMFSNNLPGGGCDGYGCRASPTAHARVLIATAGFAALNLVSPDYVIPNGFLPTDGGTLNYALVDQVTFASLPTDGINALSRSGMVIPNVATNFMGASGSVMSAAAVNYQGLWFNPAEAGWGINFAHQGDLIFASWFTYDLTGKGTWLVMTASKSAPNTYTGTLIQGTGPAFDAVPFPPLGAPGGATVSGLTGTGIITFSDANNGTFAYTLNGISQAKSITRQLLGPGSAAVCTFAAQPNLALATANYTDLWWAAPAGLEAGWGINLTQQGNLIFATWFTFDHDHTPMWLVGTASMTSPGVYTATQIARLTGPPFNTTPFPPLGAPGGPVFAVVGNATFTFIDGNTATFNYTVDGVTQTKTITRQVFTAPGTTCQ
ncbi:MAG: hypothetical protein ABI900_03820 [Betaproteobacteria bacterium]